MIRRQDWFPRLVQYMGECARTPFAEGSHDCALFTAGAVEAMTGEDYAAPYRGRYTTTKGGLRMLRKAGHADQIALAAANLPEIPVGSAGPGDVAAVATPEGEALGIVQGAGVYVMAAGGMGILPASQITRAFRVG